MAKTLPPGIVSIPDVETPFVLNAVPDTFDERDMQYRPRLQPLPRLVDNRSADHKAFFVLTQRGNSCTGHAVAGVINTILARQADQPGGNGQLVRVSPYMLYYLARRYDEFEGEADQGSSLRGAFKGWFNHGVCPEDFWPDLNTTGDLDEPNLVRACREYPLGAYYRINPFRLDDLQSAINELEAIAVSAAIHDGWIKPAALRNARGQTMHVIQRSLQPKLLGGHAFMIVGYNEVGFLVQNSWGAKWGKGGYATLPYEDWLESAYDAWVARPGVPQTPFYGGRTHKFAGTGGELVLSDGPDLKRLANHVINLGNDGFLSTSGSFRSSPRQIEQAFTHMDRWHAAWAEEDPDEPRQIIIYAHGGLNSEKTGLGYADASLNWWLNNHVYPLYFAWETGLSESIMDQLMDALKPRMPFGGLGIDLVEQFDRLVEKVARRTFMWVWDQMKQNAMAASAPLPANAQIQWPPDPASEKAMFRLPGASLLASRLQLYRQTHGVKNVRIHLVGHSAGSIFHAGLIQRLAEIGLPVASLTYLAPGLRADEFESLVLPHIGAQKTIKRFTIFNLSDGLELGDSLGQGGLTVYHKSLLYLVARGLERPPRPGMFETPLMGLERSLREPLRPGSDKSMLDRVQAVGGELVLAPSQAPSDTRCNAKAHGEFDNDENTMTSVLLRILDRKRLGSLQPYQEHVQLEDDRLLNTAVAAALQVRAAQVIPSGTEVQEAAAEVPLDLAAAGPLEAQSAPPAKPVYTGTPIGDVLAREGWQPVEEE